MFGAIKIEYIDVSQRDIGLKKNAKVKDWQRL